ncbi:hypothetical protein EYF80_036603 [Liparis tanakae]|uniref:Uncharacterized protein n=1 Tax=Liparis tanakae TaxID=230148 RepID=A0A4Z2GK76_9TELE|nr:hypothetical protein EYF80_036603 [Liparis tanakae]
MGGGEPEEGQRARQKQSGGRAGGRPPGRGTSQGASRRTGTGNWGTGHRKGGLRRTGLKAGFRTPDRVLTGALLPLRRVREKTKKQTLMTPRMITPEMSALRIATGLQRRQADTKDYHSWKGVIVNETTAVGISMATIKGHFSLVYDAL